MLKLYFLFITGLYRSSYSDTDHSAENQTIPVQTRRILNGVKVTETRPYMVYLRPAPGTYLDPNWVCGGVIIDEYYVLTSAACIEDVSRFYVVAGTHRWVPPTQTTECIENGAIRAIWKCIPRTYRFDGSFFNNIRWMVNDIAVVKTENAFDFQRRIKGCDYIPKKINYNNISKDYESPGRKGFLAGWGSPDSFTNPHMDRAKKDLNSYQLSEANTEIIDKTKCKNRWHSRYHNIIEKYMICGKSMTTDDISGDCEASYATCRQLFYADTLVPRRRKFENDSDQFLLDSANEARNQEKENSVHTRRLFQTGTGGFCENDHGGPLLVGQGRAAMVVGIISAYKTRKFSDKCYGPFLFSSVYDNRFLIQCALYKETTGQACRTVLRDTSSVLEEETFDWGSAPAKIFIYEDMDMIKSENVRRSENVNNNNNNTKANENPDAGLIATDPTN